MTKQGVRDLNHLGPEEATRRGRGRGRPRPRCPLRQHLRRPVALPRERSVTWTRRKTSSREAAPSGWRDRRLGEGLRSGAPARAVPRRHRRRGRSRGPQALVATARRAALRRCPRERPSPTPLAASQMKFEKWLEGNPREGDRPFGVFGVRYQVARYCDYLYANPRQGGDPLKDATARDEAVSGYGGRPRHVLAGVDGRGRPRQSRSLLPVPRARADRQASRACHELAQRKREKTMLVDTFAMFLLMCCALTWEMLLGDRSRQLAVPGRRNGDLR